MAIVFACVTLALTTLGAQAARPRGWTVPRTLDGKPDLQGNWTNATITPIERPEGATGPTMSIAAAEKIEKDRAARAERLAEPSDPNRPAPPVGGDGSTGAAGNVGGYNYFYIDPGDRIAVIDGQPRSSLVVDPPDGRIPALTDEARKRATDRAVARQGLGQYDHPELRPLAERCIVTFGTVAPPMLPNYFYNNNVSIVQTKDHLLILSEMVHDARVIRIGGQHPPAHLRYWFGDSIGWWDGDTLVVETTNFHPQQQLRGASEHLTVTERFARTGPNTILYRFTVDDPSTFVRPWSGELPFHHIDELVYEYACHEGNYALSNILSGERARERAAATKKSQ
jgi:hypothetical protein